MFLQLRSAKFASGFPGGSDGKKSACKAGDPGLIPGSERSSGEGIGNPLWYSCPENPMNRGAWQATVRGGQKESDITERQHTHRFALNLDMFPVFAFRFQRYKELTHT